MRAEITKLNNVSRSWSGCALMTNKLMNCWLVKAIDSCDVCHQDLQGIFLEADEVGKGKGDLLKAI